MAIKATFEWFVTKDDEILLKTPEGSFRILGNEGNMTMREFFMDGAKSVLEKNAQNEQKDQETNLKNIPLRLQLPKISELPKEEACFFKTAEEFCKDELVPEGWQICRGLIQSVSRELTKISEPNNWPMVIVPTDNGRNKVYGFHYGARAILDKKLMKGELPKLRKYGPSAKAVQGTKQ